MTAARWQRVESLFDELAACDAQERQRQLDALRGDEPELFRILSGLLAADGQADGILDVPLALSAAELLAGQGDPTPEPARARPGTRIGAYQLERELGHGGMGIVYLAHRADGAYDQHVALKLLRGGLTGELLEQRFLRERRILARLQHPNIARLLDAGTTAEGTPYFVMEYVAGAHITAWAAHHEPPIRQRLALFLNVIDAVQHAHRNLIVHRDLKPGNILVTDSGEVRLLDFGIARLLDEPGAAPQPGEQTGTLALTLDYAAPELLRGEAATIASDVYALGGVLYELLSGHKHRELAARGYEGILAALRSEPARLDRLPHLRDTLRKALRGDVTAIVHKALAADATRRYATAEAMAGDIRRHLDHQPVIARPESNWYRTAKFVRRHRFSVAATIALALAVAGGLVGTSWQSHLRGIEARKAEEVKDFVLKLFSGVDPGQALGGEISARQLVEEGAFRLEREFTGQPAIRAEIITFLADLFDKLGDQERAETMIGEAIAILEPGGGGVLGDALQIRGRIRISRGDYAAGEADIGQARSLHHAAGMKVATAEDLDQLAIAAQRRGDMAAARRFIEEGLALRLEVLGHEHDAVAESYNNLGVIAHNTGDLAMAERHHATALSIRRRVLPEHHPGTTMSLNNLGALMLSLGRYRQAEDYFNQSLAGSLALYGADHPLTITARNNLGTLELRLGRFPQAHAQLEQVLHYWRSNADENHPNALITRYNLAATAIGQGRFAVAEPELRALQAHWHATFGEAHLLTAAAEYALGQLALEQGRLAAAERWLNAALAHRRTALSDSHAHIADSLRGLAQLALARGDLPAAVQLIDQALETQAALSPDHPAGALTRLVQARWMLDAGQPEAALPQLELDLDLLATALAADHPDLVRGRFDRARAWLALDQATAAAADLADVHDALSARLGADAWQTALVECWLATALHNSGRRAQARPIARHAAQVLDQHELADLSEVTHARHMLAILDHDHHD